MLAHVIPQQVAERTGDFEPGDVADAGQNAAGYVGQGVFQGVDRPPGAQVIGAVDDQDRDVERPAGGDQGRFVPRLPEFGPDGVVAVLVDAEPRGGHVIGVAHRIGTGELGGPLQDGQLPILGLGSVLSPQLRQARPVAGQAFGGGSLERLAPGPAQASTAAAGGHRAASQRLGDRLKAGLAELGAAGGPDRAESFVAVWLPADQTGRPEHWLVDLKNHSVTLTGAEAQENSDWDIVGSAQAWEQVTGGQLNLGAALRSCRLRYCDGAESGPVASDARIAMLARLLDLASW